MKKNNNKNNKNKRLDESKINHINSPNPWTPQIENEWLSQPYRDLLRRFPPLSKPPHISRRSKNRS